MSFITVVPKLFESKADAEACIARMKESKRIHYVFTEPYDNPKFTIVVGFSLDDTFKTKQDYSDARPYVPEESYCGVLYKDMLPITLKPKQKTKEKELCLV